MAQFAKSILLTLSAIFLVYVIVYLGTLIRNTIAAYNYIGINDAIERTVMIEGVGVVAARTDVARTVMGMRTEADTVGAAQQENTSIISDLKDRLLELGVEEDDIQTTSYNIYPLYRYTEENGQELRGYEVFQELGVKIRDLARANDVLALAGDVGANTISGLQFTVDDSEAYVDQAREEALAEVKKKAQMLAQELGVDLVKVVSYEESTGQQQLLDSPYPILREAGYGAGGSSIESGTNDVSVTARVTFEIR
jgi:uncharacterized protein YggE